MKRWPTKPLEKIAELFGGSTPSRDDPTFWGGDIHWVTPTDLPMPDEGVSVVTRTKDRITKAGLDNSSATVVPKGTVLFSSRATIGKVAVAAMPLTTNQGFANFVPGPEVSSRFLAYSLWYRREDIARLSGSTTFKEVSRSTLRKYHIPVPPLPEQERIVKLLDEADELRKLRIQADRRTADLIPALFHEMFGEAERNTKKWPTKKVAEVCDLVRGSSPRPKSDPRYYGGPVPRLMIEDITRDGWLVTPRVDSLTKLGATMSRPVSAGTIVMAVSGNIGLCAQLAVDACVHDGFVAFKDLRAECFIPLFFGMAMSHMRRSHERNQAGAIFQNITTTDVKAMRIPVPPLVLQKDFAQWVAEIRELEAGQTASCLRLEDLFQSMLHRAFEGEL